MLKLKKKEDRPGIPENLLLWCIAHFYHEQWRKYEHKGEDEQCITSHCNEQRRKARHMGEANGLSRLAVDDAISRFDWESKALKNERLK